MGRTDRSASLAASPAESQPETAGGHDGSGSAPYYPEGGWGYVVVVAAFTALMVQMGLIVSMGVYLEHIESEFDSGAGLSGWISSGCFAVLAFVCPLAGIVMKRFGCRLTAMLGGIIMCIGFVCGTFAKSVLQLFMFADVIAGIGGSMCHISGTVVIGQYFNKRYALANGFAYMGQGVGIFLFPPILETMINQYGWRGCLLVQGAISLHITLAASLYRPVKRPVSRRPKHALNDAGTSTYRLVGGDRQASGYEGADNNDPSRGATELDDDSKTTLADESTRGVGLSALSGHPSCFTYEENLELLEKDLLASAGSTSCSDFGAECYGSLSSLAGRDGQRSASCQGSSQCSYDAAKLEGHFSDDSGMESPMASSSCSSVGRECTASLSGQGVRVHVRRFPGESCRDEGGRLASPRSPDVDRPTAKRRRWLSSLRIITDYPSLHFIFAIFLFETFGYGGFFSHVVARVREMNITESKATLALSIFGIGSLAGRASNGWILDRGLLTAKALNAASLIISACASVLTALVGSYAGVMAGSFFAGLGSGWYLPLQQVLLRNIVGQSKLHMAYGYGLVFEGAGSLAGGFVIGYFRDISETYKMSFYILGVVFLLGVAVFALDHFCERRGSQGRGSDESWSSLATKAELAASDNDKCTAV